MHFLQKRAEDAACAVSDARSEAAHCRSALFSHTPPDAPSNAERVAWETKATELRAACATAEKALVSAESEAGDSQSRLGDIVTRDGDGGAAMLASALAGAPPEVREYRELLRTASLGRVVSSAMRGETLSSGVEVEIRQAGGLPDDAIPYELLDPGIRAAGAALQHRVDAVSGGLSSVHTIQQTIIQRVFAPASCVSVLGCRILSAGVGDALIPIITSGQTPEFKAKGARVDAAAGAIGVFVRQPKRLSAGWLFAIEDEARVEGFEPALRMDLGRSMSDSLDKQILGLGDGQVRGLLATAANGGIADLTAASTTVDYAAALVEFARGVDGLHAAGLEECALLVRNEVYSKLATLLNVGSGMTAVQHGSQMLGMLRASANLPAPASNRSTGIMAKRGQGDMMNSYIPMWVSRGVRLIRDEVTKAAEGEVRLTASSLYNHALVRPDGFTRTTWQTA